MRTTLKRHAGLVPDRTPRGMRWLLEDIMDNALPRIDMHTEFSWSPRARRFRSRMQYDKHHVRYRRSGRKRKEKTWPH